jgi:uncharacterized protein YndB with AHSA1/START domain
MTETKADGGTRSLNIQHEIDVVPEIVWQTLTDPDEISRWFPLQAEVDPKVGGRIWLSWGPGCEGEAPIHIWEPPRRFGWTENYGTDEAGKAIEVAVDFHVEAKAGTTVVRLVQSGFSASSDWDEMYDALVDGWTYFMFNLVFYLTRHRGKPRGMAWRRVATDLARDAVWDRLLGGALVTATAGFTPGAPFELQLDAEHRGEIVSAQPGHHFAGTLPSMNNSLLFVELEGPHVGLWLSTYGSTEADVARLQRELDARLEEALLGE